VVTLYRKVVRKAVAVRQREGERGDRTRVLKMEATIFSEIVVSAYETTWYRSLRSNNIVTSGTK
jgi:hypothetical protein